ncbi:MAG: tail fiber domain-containing protein, partial [Chthoniobacterales bacterium]
VDATAVLAKVAAMPVMTWNYRTQDESIRHIGPTAQDFRAAFGLGENDKTISTIDPSGVALAAIQGLVEELKLRDKTIEELKAKLDAVEQRLESFPPAP